MRVLISGIAGVSALTLSHHGKLDMSKMNPERVAALLRETQAEWVGFALKEQSHEAAQAKMVSSCGDIVRSMVSASGGDKGRVRDYFQEVCTAEDSKCQNFAAGVLKFLSDDSEINREDLDTKKLCTSFWSTNIAAYAERAAEQREAEAKAAREAEERRKSQELERKERARRAAEEAKKKREAAHAAAIEKRKTEAKARAEKLAAEKVAAEKKAAEKKKAAEEAKKKAAEKAAKETASKKPVNILKKKASSQQVIAPAMRSAEKMVESEVKNVASTVMHFMDKMQARLGNTMADILRKKSEPNHYQKARARGQAEVAEKVNAIKARIDAKFAEEAKNAAASKK